MFKSVRAGDHDQYRVSRGLTLPVDTGKIHLPADSIVRGECLFRHGTSGDLIVRRASQQAGFRPVALFPTNTISGTCWIGTLQALQYIVLHLLQVRWKLDLGHRVEMPVSGAATDPVVLDPQSPAA